MLPTPVLVSDDDARASVAAMRLLERAYQAVFAQAHAGMTADAIDDVLRAVIEPAGGTLGPTGNTPYLVAPGGHPPKSRVNRQPLPRQGLWGMDLSISLDGRWADLGRYGHIGPLPAPLREAHQRVLERQDQIAAEVKPGRSLREIYDTVPHDIPFEVHSIGRSASASPFCGDSIPSVLRHMGEDDARGLRYQDGQIICIELWAGLDGGIEDMYQVTTDGVRRLSTLPRQIVVIQN